MSTNANANPTAGKPADDSDGMSYLSTLPPPLVPAMALPDEAQLADAAAHVVHAASREGEDRDARRVRLLDHGHDSLRVRRAEHDGRRLFHDEVLHLIALPRHIAVRAHHQRVVTVLRRLGGDVVANHFEKRILQRQQ